MHVLIQVSELSRPSSPEVEEIMHELAQNILRRFFKDEIPPDYEGDLAISSMPNYEEMENELCDTIVTSRDYLAKLLFWLVYIIFPLDVICSLQISFPIIRCMFWQVHVNGPSSKRLGEQTTSKLRCWFVISIKNMDVYALVSLFFFSFCIHSYFSDFYTTCHLFG